MLRLDQEAMKALFQPTLRAIIEVIKKKHLAFSDWFPFNYWSL